MLEKGYDPERDSWSINELPSSVRSDPQVRQNVRDVVKGLYEGDGVPMGGLVYVIGMGSQTQNMSVYKPNLKDWTLDAGFWSTMNQYVRWWAQESYIHPAESCVGSATVGQRAAYINDYLMHPAKLAVAGPAGAGNARGFFNESYFPLMNGFWKGIDAYGTANTSLENMKHHASTQIYAARAWSSSHVYPDWRTGFAWNDSPDGATPEQIDELATRIARAIRSASPRARTAKAPPTPAAPPAPTRGASATSRPPRSTPPGKTSRPGSRLVPALSYSYSHSYSYSNTFPAPQRAVPYTRSA
jgi:hypothetical protein